MGVSSATLEAVNELFAFVPELRIKRMFGGAGVFSGELMFALAFEDDVYLRVDEASLERFAAAGSSQFTYGTKDGERMSLGYWRAPDEVWDDPEAARRWTEVSLEAARRKKTGSRKSKGRKPPELLISGPWDEG